MRKIASLLAALALMLSVMLCCGITAGAEKYGILFIDNGNCFTYEEETAAKKLLAEAAASARCNIGVVTQDSFTDTNPKEFAQSMLDAGFGAGSSSILLVISTDFDNPDAFDFIDMSGGAYDSLR